MGRFTIRPMSAADARAIAAWRYPPPYSFYDLDRDPDDLDELLDPSQWGRTYFVGHDDHGLAGFFMVKHAGDVAEIGLGLRPELTGAGLGASFLQAGMAYSAATLGAKRYTLAVAAFNRRAITVYERAGFREIRRGEQETNGGVHQFIWMARPS